MAARLPPIWRPCVACGMQLATNRPMSYYLRKGVRKHLAEGVCYRTEVGARAMMPPLGSISEMSCMCLGCAQIIGAILALCEKIPFRAASAAASRGPTRSIARTRQAASSAVLMRGVARTNPMVVAKKRSAVSVAPKPAPSAPVVLWAVAKAAPEAAPLTRPKEPAHATEACASKLAERVAPVAPLLTAVQLNLPENMRGVPDGQCIVCYCASGGTRAGGAVETMGKLRDEVVRLVGEHPMTLESVVRIFRAARVELAEGVCEFDFRAFASLVLHRESFLCTPHFGALVQAAEVKAAGAVPCAVCGKKPTLVGCEEVRSLSHVTARLDEQKSRGAVCAEVLRIMRARGDGVEVDAKKFEEALDKFLEKEFACATCLTAVCRAT